MTNGEFLRRFVVAGGALILVLPGVAQNPALQLSSSSLTFNAIAGGPKPAMQAVTVTSVTSTAIDFALLVDGGAPGTPAPAWLSVTPLLATTPADIRVTVDPSGLAAGPYSARIQLTDRQGRTLGIILPVTMQAAAGTPQFDVTPSSVNFSGSLASGTLQQGLLVRSLGPGSIAPVTVSMVSGYAGLYATVDACDTVCVVHVNTATTTLSPGAHNGVVRITTAAGSKDVPVSLFVADHGSFDQLSFSAIPFEAVQVSGLMDSRTVLLSNNGDSVSTWSADVPDGSQWLSVSPSTGTIAPGSSTSLTVSMNLGNQGPGAYGGMIRISSPDPNAVTLYLPAVLKVLPTGSAATPVLSSNGLVLTTQTGTPESVQQQISLSAASTTPVNFQASPQSSSWLSLVPARGLASSTPTTLTVSAAGANQAAGFYSGLINIGFGTASVRSMHVGFAVTAATGAPTCQPQLTYVTETAIPDNFAVRTGSPTPLEVVYVDDCGTPIVNGSIAATFSNGDAGVELVSIGNGHYTQTWTPGNPSDSLPGGNVSVAFQAFAPPLKPASTEVIGAVIKESTLPAIATGGVINSFITSSGTPVAPGAVVQIFGSALATGTASGTVANGKLSTSVGGTSLKIGGLDAPIAYASPTQINAQLPAELLPNRQYQVIVNANGVYSKPEPINTIAAQPVLAAFSDGRIIAQDVNFNLINAQNPAHAGQVITLYLTGMGATNPPVPTGTLAPGSPLAVTASQPQVSIDTSSADILFSGLTPGAVGLYQVNIHIPANVRTGDLPLVVSQGGVASNTAILPVR